MSSPAWRSSRAATVFTFRELTGRGSGTHCRWTKTRIWPATRSRPPWPNRAEMDDKSSRTEAHRAGTKQFGRRGKSNLGQLGGQRRHRRRGQRRGSRCRSVSLPREEGRAAGARNQRGPQQVAARFEAGSARRGRQADSARCAASGSHVVLHVSRPQFDRPQRFPPARRGRHGVQRIPVRQRRSHEVVDEPARAGLGLPGLSGLQRRSLYLFRHDRHYARLERDVLHRRAASAGRKAHPQRPAAVHAVLRKRRRRLAKAGQRFADCVHRAGRRRLPGSRVGCARAGRRCLQVSADRATAAARVSP